MVIYCTSRYDTNTHLSGWVYMLHSNKNIIPVLYISIYFVNITSLSIQLYEDLLQITGRFHTYSLLRYIT